MHNYLIRRVLLMIPTILIISLLIFMAQEAAPGDFITRILATQQTAGGMATTDEEIDALRHQYGFDRPAAVRYLAWIGNFVRGDFGHSYKHKRPVKDLIVERMLLTALLAYSTILFSWCLSIPIGVYVATHKYSFSDTALTFIGFIGMSIPNFLLALILLFTSLRLFGVELSGLFSPEYVDAPWSMAKFLNLLQRLWIPVVILGASGTAGSIRTWRALMLDTMGEPYIKVARAKGLKERVVVWKHAVKVAANPFFGS
ncbi:MAG: ABC transporter permease, partial [Kiritimatiellota bacterium]|nr:ABC transporter permease [Kiritimatiellota bacterium]